ncbi:MAG: hypothetical protein ABIK28_15305, partial [Planctomycetota bacterium]
SMKIKIIILAIFVISILCVGIVNANKPNIGLVPMITISPSTLIMSAPTPCVSVHSNIPYNQVDCSTLELSGLLPYLAKSDARGDLVVKFDGEDVKAIVELGPFALTLTGDLIDGTSFAAFDTIIVKP